MKVPSSRAGLRKNREQSMAVGPLSGRWIYQVLRDAHPGGVLRRALLDQFAAILVSKRSTAGAKGRLARRLYARLDMLQRRGLIEQEDGIVRPLEPGRKAAAKALPLLGPILRKKQFVVFLAEDRDEDRTKAANLRATRWDFLACAVAEGWELAQAASAIGLPLGQALELTRGARPAAPTPEGS